MSGSRILADRVALVTGGSRGLGRAIALTLADAGADVVVSSRGKLPGLEQVAREIEDKGVVGMAVTSHVGNLEDSKALVEEVTAKFGRIDILVNNAGTFGWYGRLMDADEAGWDRAFNVNLKGPFFLSQMVAQVMREQGGSIINIASIGGIRLGTAYFYSVSKAALMALTQCLAIDWGQYNIRVNAIAPGLVRTHLVEARRDPDGVERELVSNALGKAAVPEDIANAALFLVSDKAAHITGTTLVVDGGQLMSMGVNYPVEQYFRSTR